MIKDSTKGLVSAYCAVALLATNGIFAKSIRLPPNEVTLVRSIVATFCLFIVITIFKLPLKFNNLKEFAITAILGIVLILHWDTLFESIRHSTIAIGMTLLYTYPIFTVVFESLINRQPLSAKNFLISMIVVIGVYIMSPFQIEINESLNGVVFGLTSAILFAIRNVLQRHWLSHKNPITIMFYQTFSGLLFLIPFCEISFSSLSVSEWEEILLLGVFFTAIPHSFLAYSLQYLSARSVSFIGCMQPIIAAVLAIGILNEWPSWNIIAGATLVLTSTVYETLKVK